jgi:hypothetical protein
MKMDDDVIRASEIGQYTYCARAWWLTRVKGLPSANVAQMQAGSEQHRLHGRAVEHFYRLRRAAWVLLLLASVLVVAWIVLSLAR